MCVCECCVLVSECCVSVVQHKPNDVIDKHKFLINAYSSTDYSVKSVHKRL